MTKSAEFKFILQTVYVYITVARALYILCYILYIIQKKYYTNIIYLVSIFYWSWNKLFLRSRKTIQGSMIA